MLIKTLLWRIVDVAQMREYTYLHKKEFFPSFV